MTPEDFEPSWKPKHFKMMSWKQGKAYRHGSLIGEKQGEILDKEKHDAYMCKKCEVEVERSDETIFNDKMFTPDTTIIHYTCPKCGTEEIAK